MSQIVLPLLMILSLGAHAEPIGGMLLKVIDEGRLITAPPQVSITGEDGTSVTVNPTDDGNGLDAVAADDIWSSALGGLKEGPITMVVSAGDAQWMSTLDLQLEGKDKPILELTLAGGGQLSAELSEPRARTEGWGVGDVADLEGVETLAGEKFSLGAYLLGALLLAILGLFSWWVRSSPQRTTRPTGLTPPVPQRDVPPLSITAEDLQAWIASEAESWQLVVLGKLPGSATAEGRPPHHHAEPGCSPGELVAACEAVAMVSKQRVALLVTEPGALDQGQEPSPLRELQQRVAGRFPLWVVAGPARWKRWEPQHP